MDSKERHFYRLGETSEAVWSVMEALVNRQYEKDNAEYLRKDMDRFLNKRLRKLLLRPYLVRLAYELAGGTDWKSILNILAAAELLNISTYQSNICFDQKVNINASNCDNQFIASMVSLSLAQIAICEQKWESDHARSIALETVAKCNLEVYEGQHIDINRLCLNNYSHIDSFLPDYIHRCELIGGTTFMITAIGALAANRDDKLFKLLKSCYRKFGAAAQMINDLADYIPAKNLKDNPKYSRPYTDSYGDLRMGRLTYPTYVLLQLEGPDKHISDALIDIHRRWKYLVPVQQELLIFTDTLMRLNIRGKVEGLMTKKCWNGKGGIKETLREIKEIAPSEAYRDLMFIRSFMFGSSMLLYFQNISKRKSDGTAER